MPLAMADLIKRKEICILLNSLSSWPRGTRAVDRINTLWCPAVESPLGECVGSGTVCGDLPGRKNEAAEERSRLLLEVLAGSAATPLC